MTEVFLGEPPAHIKQWIIDHKPQSKTIRASDILNGRQNCKMVLNARGTIYNIDSRNGESTRIEGFEQWNTYPIGVFGQILLQIGLPGNPGGEYLLVQLQYEGAATFEINSPDGDTIILDKEYTSEVTGITIKFIEA